MRTDLHAVTSLVDGPLWTRRRGWRPDPLAGTESTAYRASAERVRHFPQATVARGSGRRQRAVQGANRFADSKSGTVSPGDQYVTRKVLGRTREVLIYDALFVMRRRRSRIRKGSKLARGRGWSRCRRRFRPCRPASTTDGANSSRTRRPPAASAAAMRASARSSAPIPRTVRVTWVLSREMLDTPPTTEEASPVNPLGLYVTDLRWTKRRFTASRTP